MPIPISVEELIFVTNQSGNDDRGEAYAFGTLKKGSTLRSSAKPPKPAAPSKPPVAPVPSIQSEPAKPAEPARLDKSSKPAAPDEMTDPADSTRNLLPPPPRNDGDLPTHHLWRVEKDLPMIPAWIRISAHGRAAMALLLLCWGCSTPTSRDIASLLFDLGPGAPRPRKFCASRMAARQEQASSARKDGKASASGGSSHPPMPRKSATAAMTPPWKVGSSLPRTNYVFCHNDINRGHRSMRRR